MSCKAAHETEALGPYERLNMGRLRGPLQGALSGDVGGSLSFWEGHEIQQPHLDLFELESQGTSQGHIILHTFSELFHRPPPGQGSAKLRNAGRSTLA
jgi:hypothetical protein